MKALVVYDSVFSNTEQVARAISDSPGAESRAIRVGDARHEELRARAAPPSGA